VHSEDGTSSINIYDITPFSAIDYPEKLSAIIWIGGCNLRCLYCHNPEIVFGENIFPFEKVESFLKKRRNVLQGVVISGGEPTLHPSFLEIIERVKRLGYLIKIDTNGALPSVLREGIKNGFVDYVAIDFKATREKYKLITGKNIYDNVLETIKLLNASKIEFEVRTTVHSFLLGKEDIEEIAQELKKVGYRGVYYLQNFSFSGKTLKSIKHPHLSIQNWKLNLPVEYKIR
jgi:pyruvate formate lyase activating enzyme